ncbi:MAG: bifunctional UDP-N-acetylglucosamine diphosphorylase/glucosamine-1-phosphate N-acetyltransferase GlmU [Desulfovibrionaceae bacterium]|nr:bifunctional UDP-N-acetylglucosamine diphosphorylase/glucosamine-1-phosphate N-acetyltransferase GlmU [Desulfovibrionaceae bacterium]
MLHALVLAAGKGTRMCSTVPKVLQPILGEPMLLYVLEAVATVCEQDNTSVLVGHKSELVKQSIHSKGITFIEQGEQLGTGHALYVAWEQLQHQGVDRLLVVNGDVPLLSHSHLHSLLTYFDEEQLDIAFLTTTVEETGDYGVVIRENEKVYAIIEAKDLDPSLYSELNEINTGIYVFSMQKIAPLLPYLTNNNIKGEYYITQLISLAVENGLSVGAICLEDNKELLGVNTPLELVESEEILREKICLYWLMKGVHIHNYLSVSISPTVEIEPGTVIYGPCTITGKTMIGEDVVIEPYCYIHNATIHSGVNVRSFSHIDSASLGSHSRVGPFARLRPDVLLGNNVRIGNFVEIKKSTVGSNVAINHLSYIGDATIGEKTNIGAGTITCNYDGSVKHSTTIGSNVFVGSITALIAPISIGDNSTIGAGSVITKSVQANTLALSRSEQKAWQKK